jgi:hypothetical protein
VTQPGWQQHGWHCSSTQTHTHLTSVGHELNNR